MVISEKPAPPEVYPHPREVGPQTEAALENGLAIRVIEPPYVLTNDEIERWKLKTSTGKDLTAEKIKEITGIETRRIAEDISVQQFGKAAAIPLVESHRDEIENVLFMTSFPSTEDRLHGNNHAQSLIQDLGLENADLNNALDLHFACSTGAHFATFPQNEKRTLLVGSEIYSPHLVNPRPENQTREEDPSHSYTIFSDAAAAMILTPGENFTPIYSITRTYSEDANRAILMPTDKSAMQMPYKAIDIPYYDTFQMDGRKVYQEMGIVGYDIAEIARIANEYYGINIDDIAAIIPHQASLPVLERGIKEKIKVNHSDELADKLVIDVAEGNTSSVSILKSMAKQINKGNIKDNDYVILAGFGAGLFSSVQLVRLGPKKA